MKKYTQNYIRLTGILKVSTDTWFSMESKEGRRTLVEEQLMGQDWAGRRNVISAEAIGGFGEFLWQRWMKYEESSTEMMKDNSTAPAMTVLHTSSHSCSVDREEFIRTLLFPTSAWAVHVTQV